MGIKDQYWFISIILFLVLFLFFSPSCRTARSVTSTVSDQETTERLPEIIFLNYSVKPDAETGRYKIHLIDKLITGGKLKTSGPEAEITKPGDLKCFALNIHSQPVDSLIISDPLNVTLESVDIEGNLFKREVKLDSSSFTVRLQLNKDISYVAILKKQQGWNQDSCLVLTKIR